MNLSKTRLSGFVLAALCALSVPVAAQGAMGEEMEKMRKQMDEIANLMRTSEQLLLEVSNVDQLVRTQKDVDAKLQELLKDPPPPQQANAGQAAEQRRQKQEELEKKQGELKEKLQRLLQGQGRSGQALERGLAELLRSWPRGNTQTTWHKDPRNERSKKKKSDADESQKKPRELRDQMRKAKERKKKEAERKKSALERRVDAWLVRLPPEEQERLRRGDFSNVPQRYRRLVERYTINAAKREAEEDTSER